MTPLVAFSLDPYIRDWLDLALRMLHVIAAIGWIGSSFYFMLLDQSLRPAKDQADTAAGVKGEAWEVHGGGFYHVQKYQVTPKELPEHLTWFKWEAYSTWLTGFALIVVLFWFDAGARMIDPNIADLTSAQAVGISAAMLAGAWVLYDVFCRVLWNKNTLLLGVLVGVLALAAAWGSGELFSARTAWLQTGAMLGTIMAGNVFFNIIPAHWELIRAKEQGRDPDPTPGLKAKARSVHNNYLTLPVLLTMLAGHFPFLTAHEYSWVILGMLMFLGAFIRHYYNLRHSGKNVTAIPAICAVLLISMVVLLWPGDKGTDKADAPSGKGSKTTSGPTNGNAPAGEAGKDLFSSSGCGGCHTLSAGGGTGTAGPNLDTLQPEAATVVAAVTNGKGSMPAFGSKLSDDEIETLAGFVAENAGE